MPDLDSLAIWIDALARETSAPESFVRKVRDLFERKGISLEESAAPYRTALEEAFRREGLLRKTSREHREQLDAARREIGEIDRTWREQLQRLQEARDQLRAQTRGLDESERRGRTVLCPGSVEMPFVPGPTESQ